jgi:hypothetical protein
LRIIEVFNAKPAGDREWKARCPAHEDRKPSLSISEGADGRVLMICRAGCEIKAVLAEHGLTLRDLFPESPRRSGRNTASSKRIVAKYDYPDASGKLLFQTVRYDPKDFKQRRPNGNDWIWNLNGIEPVLFRLPQITKAIREGLEIFLVEGEKDVLVLDEHGLAATCNPMGAKKWRDSYSETLRGAEVVIVADKDEKGREHAQLVASKLHGIAKFVRVLEPPEVNGKKIKDSADYFAAGGTIEQLVAFAAAAPEWAPGQDSAPPLAPQNAIPSRLNSDLPKVQLPGDGHLLSTFAADCADVLKDCGVYERGGVAFIVNQARNGLDVITAAMLRTLAEQHLICFRRIGHGGNAITLPRTMSMDDAQGVLSAQQFLSRLPKVTRIATARLPVMRASGVIELLPSGYDRESFTLTLPQCDYDSGLSISSATQTIDELLAEFPFADDGRSKSVAIAATVGLYGAALLGTGIPRPVVTYLANAEGAGKTLLAKCAISPTHGMVKTDGDLKDKGETAKELLAAVIETRPYILFDNCKRHLDSPYLEAFVSSAIWSGRILGVSKMFAGENLMTVFITGNGCTVSPDMRRRSLFVELFMEAERAEDRKFERVLDDAALLALRPQILAALWALVREWDTAGRPKPSRTHTAFPRWADVIGGIVEHAGYGCPLTTADIEGAADVDGADMHELAKLLADNEPVKFDELVALSREHGLFERIVGSDDKNDLKPSDKSSLGKLLKRYDQRVFGGGRRFVVAGKGRSRTFKIVSSECTGRIGCIGVSPQAEKDAFPSTTKTP